MAKNFDSEAAANAAGSRVQDIEQLRAEISVTIQQLAEAVDVPTRVDELLADARARCVRYAAVHPVVAAAVAGTIAVSVGVVTWAVVRKIPAFFR